MLKDSGGKPDIILIATGSEMEITLQAAEKLAGEGRNVRVVSLPSTDIFDAQDEEYRESVLPSNVAARVAVEAGIADYWYKYVGLKGAIVGMTGYGNLLRRISCSRSLALPPRILWQKRIRCWE